LRRTLSAYLLLIYAFVVVGLTVPPIAHHRESLWAGTPWWSGIQLVPLNVDLPSFVLNVLMFAPFGVLVPLVRPRADSFWRIVAYSAIASTCIEGTQLVLNLTMSMASRRTVDVNDLLANTAGAAIGLCVLRLAVPDRAQRAQLGRVELRFRR
jgi:glycopeptide antibiotics resistance protein